MIKIDLWIASVANGATFEEEWLPGYLSPWQRLMDYCKKEHTYLTGLRLAMGEEVVALPSNGLGYWQAHGMPTIQGIRCDEELHKWRGIGIVVKDQAGQNMINIVWAARDPVTHKTVWWSDSRDAQSQRQVIWSIAHDPSLELVPKSKADPRGLKVMSDRIVEEGGGLKEPVLHSH